VWTDHGFLLGEKECCAKIWMPFYEEVAHTPFFVWDPRAGTRNERRQALVQPSIDLGPTLLELFGVERTSDMLGRSLGETIASDKSVREAGIFGVHGAQVNVTDGRHVYMRAPAREDGQPLFNYTHMPTHMRQPFGVDDLRQMTLAEPFTFTKGCPTMKLPSRPGRANVHPDRFKHLLYDLQSDPTQERPIEDAVAERRMIGHLARLMKECDAPPEQFERLGITSA